MGRGFEEPVSLGQGLVLRATDKALLIALEDLGEPLWVPKSVVHDDSEVYGPDAGACEGELVVKAWWAEANGHGG